MYAIYLDDSGSHRQSDRFIIAGAISTVDAWLQFTNDWGSLCKGFGIGWFHMVDAESGHNEFEGWDKPERYAAIEAFATLVQRHVSHGFCASFDFKTYREAVEPLFKEFSRGDDGKQRMKQALVDPYQQAYIQALSLIAGACKHLEINPGDVEIAIAKQKGQEWAAGYYWHWFRQRLELRDPVFGEPRGLAPLQGADMYGWRRNRSITHPSEEIPKRHRGLLALRSINGHMAGDLVRSMVASLRQSFEAVAAAERQGIDSIDAVDMLYADDPTWPRGRLEFPPR
jgi:hypothetical protein